MKWIINRQTVDSSALSSTKYPGSFTAYWIFCFELQFVSTPSGFGFRVQSFSSNSKLKHNLISNKYCSSFCSSFKQNITAFTFSWFLMALCISIASNFCPGWIFVVDRILCIAYWSCQSNPCLKYSDGVLSSWIVVAHFPCLFHWYFQNVSSRDPKQSIEFSARITNYNQIFYAKWSDYLCKCLANVVSSDRLSVPLYPFEASILGHLHSILDQKSCSLMAKHHEWPNLSVWADYIHFHRSLSSNLCKRWWAMLEKMSTNQNHFCDRYASLCYEKKKIRKRKRKKHMRNKTTNVKNWLYILIGYLFTH